MTSWQRARVIAYHQTVDYDEVDKQAQFAKAYMG
jgi:hypothetical protein